MYRKRKGKSVKYVLQKFHEKCIKVFWKDIPITRVPLVAIPSLSKSLIRERTLWNIVSFLPVQFWSDVCDVWVSLWYSEDAVTKVPTDSQ